MPPSKGNEDAQRKRPAAFSVLFLTYFWQCGAEKVSCGAAPKHLPSADSVGKRSRGQASAKSKGQHWQKATFAVETTVASHTSSRERTRSGHSRGTSVRAICPSRTAACLATYSVDNGRGDWEGRKYNARKGAGTRKEQENTVTHFFNWLIQKYAQPRSKCSLFLFWNGAVGIDE